MNVFIIKKVVYLAFILILLFVLLNGAAVLLKETSVFDVVDHAVMRMLESQYETGLIEMNADYKSGEIGMPASHRIFSDIKNMHQLDSYTLSSDISDDYLKDLSYDADYMRQIEYNDEKYDVFAYVFPNVSTSMQYYENFASFPALNFERWYEWRTNPVPSFIAYDGNLALRIVGRNNEMIALLLESFEDVFDVEFMSAQEMRDEAISSGQIFDAIDQYFSDEHNAEVEVID